MKTALRVLNDLVAEKVIKDYAIGGAMGAMFYMEADERPSSCSDVSCVRWV